MLLYFEICFVTMCEPVHGVNLTFMGLCIINSFFLSKTNKMQLYTIFFIALHASGGFSAHHQELKTVAVATSKLDIYQMLCVQF
jgi:hypothetical protein